MQSRMNAVLSMTSTAGARPLPSIFGLYKQGLVSIEEALRWATNVDEFKLKVQGISTTAEMSQDEMARTVTGPPEITRFGS